MPRRIVVLLSPSLGTSEETLRTLEDSLTEQGVITTVLLGDDAPDDILDQDDTLVQVVIVKVGSGEEGGQVEGSLTWSGKQVELLEGEQRREGEEILETVRRVVEETRRVEKETKGVEVPIQDSGVSEEVEVGVTEEMRPAPPVTVVVSLKTESELLGNRLKSEELGQRMKSQLPSVEGVVVLLNAATESIQAQLGSVASIGGAAVLLDLRVTGVDNAVSGNIYRNFVPLEQLEGGEYDETLLILLAVNKEVEQAIEAALHEAKVGETRSPHPQEGDGEVARVTEFLEEEEEARDVGFDPTASQDYSFEASSSQDYDGVGGADQDYSLGVADGQDYSLGAGGVDGQDYSSLESEDPSPPTSSFLLKDFGWEESSASSEVTNRPPEQVDQAVQLRIPEAVLNIGKAVEEEGGVPVAEPEAGHVREHFEDVENPSILVGGPVTPAHDLGEIQEVATTF